MQNIFEYLRTHFILKYSYFSYQLIINILSHMKFQDIFKKRKIIKKIGVIILWLILGFFVLMFIKDYYRYKSFLDCSIDTKAIVIDKDKRTRRSNSNRGRRTSYDIKMKYFVDEKIMQKKKSIYQGDYNKLNVGDTINIKYACEDPNWIQYKNIRNRDLILIIPKSWM